MISGGGLETLEMDGPHSDVYPFVEIIEQPASKAVRFRYECEGRSAGSIPGANSTLEYKTYPTIKIRNYHGRAIVIVSCVTKDKPYRPHPHSLVGKGTCKAGVCRMEITSENHLVSFVNLGIQCVKKKDIGEALSVREEIRVDPYRTGFEHKRQPSTVDLNSVRMCFQVFIEGREGKINVPLRPIVSEPIYDKKAMSDLMICKMSHYCATVAGGMEMIILCEKVAKDNIQVRFFERRDGREVWEGYGDFKSVNVHKQVAIAFHTPSYKNRQIDEPVEVYVQLKRPSDGVTSDPLPFKFLPLGADDHDGLKRKRRRFEESPRAHVLRRIQAEAKSQGSSLNESQFEENIDPLKLEARVQSFPVGGIITTSNESAPSINVPGGTSIQSPTSQLIDVPAYGHQGSPVTPPSPAIGYATCNAQCGTINGGNYAEHFEKQPNNRGFFQQHSQQQSPNVQQLEGSQFSDNYHYQSQRQQEPVLQKITMSQQQTFSRSVYQQDLVGAVGETDLMDIAGQQQTSFDASLNQLDSAELAAFGDALSESLSSDLSIIDRPLNIERNFISGTMPVGVRAAAPWCNL